MTDEQDEPMGIADVPQLAGQGQPTGSGAQSYFGQVSQDAVGGDDLLPMQMGFGGNASAENQESDIEGPYKKKQKMSSDSGTGEEHGQGRNVPKIEKLESRLVSLLCCTVCLDLPRAAIYQCTNGHLMCAGCFTHLMADARLRDEVPTCPNCRIEISKTSSTRNLAVEKAVNELPCECQYCNVEFPRNTVEHHEKVLCEERTMTCKYGRIGCPWRGPFHEFAVHETICTHPMKTGEEVMGILRVLDQNVEEERKLYSGIFDLLSYEKITVNDLQFKPYRTDEFVHKLYYETSRFTAFNNQWVVKARINSQQRDPTLSVDRQMTYQLLLKSKPASPMDVRFIILKGPFGDMKVNPKLHQFAFTEVITESTNFQLPLLDSAECNRILAAKTIHFRLIAFLP